MLSTALVSYFKASPTLILGIINGSEISNATVSKNSELSVAHILDEAGHKISDSYWNCETRADHRTAIDLLHANRLWLRRIDPWGVNELMRLP